MTALAASWERLRRQPGSSWQWGRPQPLAFFIALVLAAAWAAELPRVPDLSAQLARAELAATEGLVPFWTSWYAGTPALGYSVFGPLLVAVLGPQVVGVVSAAATAVAGATLLRDTRRPRSGAALLAVLAVIDVCLGRLTFAAGVAVGLAGIALATRGHRRSPLALSALCGLTSPLAGAFLALAYFSAGVAGSPPLSRRSWTGLLLASTAPIAALELMFPQTGFEPVSVRSALDGVLVCGLIVVLSPQRSLRIGALLTSLLILSAWLAPNAIGGNAVRLPEIVGPPLVVATAVRPSWLSVRTRWRRCLRYVAAVLAVVPVLLPAGELAAGLAAADSPGAQQTYWQPLLTRLSSAPGVAQHRVEVVAPAGHWEVQYLSSKVVLARGWERQTDEGLNPLFYGRAPLSDVTYRAWLDSLAVAYVAVPDGPLDSGSTDEAALIAHAPPYLSLVWRNAHWQLYAVEHPAPMVLGPGRLVSMSPQAMTLNVTGTLPVVIRVRWSPYLTYLGPQGCLSPASDWTSLRLRAPGTVMLQVRWRPTAAQVDEACAPLPS
ncbi:MAG: hypothetical protein ACXV4A_11660 [Actinomycetes bacterium]